MPRGKGARGPFLSPGEETLSAHVMTNVEEAAKNGLPSPVRLLDLHAQYEDLKDEIVDAVLRVLDSQHFILGPEVAKFEAAVAQFTGAKYAVGCASGSDALLLSLMALGIQPGDEVITSSFTFGATAGSIARLGARPVFVDILPDSFNIDPDRVATAITPRTRAIMPVHLFGLSARMDSILEIADRHHLPVIEDAAQSLGAEWQGKCAGTLGTTGGFSFFPSKNLGGAGDGGMVVTQDDEIAHRLRMLRTHGASTKYHYEIIGMNSRLDALQAAILGVKLSYLRGWAEQRRRNAVRYREMFAACGALNWITLPESDPDALHIFNQYTIRAVRRDQLRTYLESHGISTEIYYPGPLHLEPAFAYLGWKPGDLPESEAASREALSLPIYPELPLREQQLVVEAIAAFYQQQA